MKESDGIKNFPNIPNFGKTNSGSGASESSNSIEDSKRSQILSLQSTDSIDLRSKWTNEE